MAIAKTEKKRKKKDGQWAKNGAKKGVLSRKDYDKELRRLQVELLQLEEWVRQRGLRVVALFEGRDTAGKGGSDCNSARMSAGLRPRLTSSTSRSSTPKKLSPRRPHQSKR